MTQQQDLKFDKHISEKMDGANGIFSFLELFFKQFDGLGVVFDVIKILGRARELSPVNIFTESLIDSCA